jgi:hypothetical protein
MVSGRVMVDDGTPPPSSAVIERVCNGNAHSEGYTDSKGYFSLTLGQGNEVIQDASESSGGFNRNFPQSGLGAGSSSSGLGGARGGLDNQFSNCELRARLGGYRSQSVSLLQHGPMDNPDIGTILVHRLGQAEEATTVTATTLKAPKAAQKALQKGTDFAKKKKIEEAIASFQEAVKLYPEFAFAWCGLGRLQDDNGQPEEAQRSFETAAKYEPRWPEPLLHLSVLAARNHNWKELSELSDRVVRLNSFDFPEAFFFNAVANYNLKHIDVAEKSARAAQKLDTRHQYPQVDHLLGTILVDRRQYSAAADEFRSYLVQSPTAVDAAVVRKQLDDAERLARQPSDVARKDPR